MDKVYFAIGLHFHQPVGNFEEILERSYHNCYKPFIDVFSKYPNIKMSLHFSGNLLDYFEDKHPEFLDRIKDMVTSHHIEIMGGGYYEPIFQAIPKEDRIGQLEMLSSYSEERFGMRPKGMWMPERVWSPEVIEDFRKSNIKYSILDDTHLIKAGVNNENVYEHFITGDDDNEMAIFPTHKKLRYIIPFRSPHETINYFKKIAKKKKNPLFVYGDDGEKFGEWPWTYDWVYKKGWLDNFFKEITKNKDWVETVTFSEYLDLHPNAKKIHIPEAAYEEMLEWSEGSWMNFLTRYPESNQMHKRMHHISKRINELEKTLKEKEEFKKAKRELYKGQCNCSYWHGVFGGIYLNHLRSAVYEHLINADKIADNIEHKKDNNWINAKEIDFYKEHRNVITLENKNFFICIDPTLGGAIRELDYKGKYFNLINTLARRKESYHKKILERIDETMKRTEKVKIYEAIKTLDTRIKKGIFYDKYMRFSLIDHFIDKSLQLEDFANSDYTDLGNFSKAHYIATIKDKKVILDYEGKVDDNIIFISKEIQILNDNEIKILYILKNRSKILIDTFFGTEFNISMSSADPSKYIYESDKENLGNLSKMGSVSETNSISIKDSQNGTTSGLIFSEKPNKIWYYPVETVSQSERAYDLSYQSSCVFPMWQVRLEPKKEARFTINWKIV